MGEVSVHHAHRSPFEPRMLLGLDILDVHAASIQPSALQRFGSSQFICEGCGSIPSIGRLREDTFSAFMQCLLCGQHGLRIGTALMLLFHSATPTCGNGRGKSYGKPSCLCGCGIPEEPWILVLVGRTSSASTSWIVFLENNSAEPCSISLPTAVIRQRYSRPAETSSESVS